ncbi:MAG: cyclic pyranopterin monophosphate synthase MoaC [Desulfobacteraceae bacterium]|nr:cyclic pyranopterin monophosphate synthase MoaC [Desulfobacteraceae bacterium]
MTGSTMTHIDEKGRVRMVDVTEKEATERTAVASAVVLLRQRTLDMILKREMSKGNVLETARIAGIMAAKKTAELIPMCHPLNLSHAQVDFFPETDPARVTIRARVRLTGRTGVEMEALTAVTVAALTLYDMCKAVDREMRITDVQLMEKTGGKSGTFRRSK